MTGPPAGPPSSSQPAGGQPTGADPDGKQPRPTYADAGVDIPAGERAVELMKGAVAGASRPEVVGGLGGFAGLFAFDAARYRRPLLATSTDGVGTKLAIARAMDRHDTVGLDLVGMVVDDLVVCGAEPLFMTDYIACGKVVPQRMAVIVEGIAAGCRLAGCALLGGETAEHPSLLQPDDYDLAGAAVGVVDADRLLGPERVTAGDAVVGLASSGLHSNGYSLVRHALLGLAGLRLDAPLAGLGIEGQPGDHVPGARLPTPANLGDLLLTPTRIYARDCLAMLTAVDVHAFAHITGGGLAANLARVLPGHLDAVIDRAAWRPGPVFRLMETRGRVEPAEMERTFNQGIGMVAVVPTADADRGVSVCRARGLPASVIGTVVAGGGGHVVLVNAHPR